MKPLPGIPVILSDWRSDLARYQADLEVWRAAGLADEHPLPRRALRRIATLERVLAAFDKPEETGSHDG
jgi:hypothetical protein